MRTQSTTADGEIWEGPIAPTSPAPARPLCAMAIAMTLGAACGAQGFVSRECLSTLAAGLAAGWVGWRAARPRTPPLSGTSTVQAGRVSGTSAIGPGLFALVFALAALNALPEPGTRWNSEIAAWQGEWRTRRESESEIRGGLAIEGSHSLRFELPRGCARDGEEIRILRGDAPVPWVRGPREISPSPTGAAAESAKPELVVARADEVLRFASATGTESWVAGLRAALDRRAAQLEDRIAASLGRAFLLGDSSALDSATTDLFTRNGLRHVLAVSGWHVAMMAWLIVRPFGAMAEQIAIRMPRRRRALAWLSMLASVALCAAYAPLTGGGAPVRRAAIAVALASTAGLWPRSESPHRPGWSVTRRIDALSLWAAALCVECWLEPTAVFDVAVQLSYAATLGLIVATRPLTIRLAHALGIRLGARPQEQLLHWPRQCAAALGRRALRAALSGVSASIAAVVATAPIVWLTFGEACPWGMLSTPLLAPLFIALFALGMPMLASPSGIFGDLFTWVSRTLLGALEAVDRLPGTPTLLPDRPAWLLWGTLALAWVVLRRAPSQGRGLRWLSGALALCASMLALPWAPSASRLEIHVLDVGHGTAVVFRAPGEPCWIFDCGSRDRSRVAQDALAPLLRRWDVQSCKVVLSHGDSDHAGGLGWLIERAPPSHWAGALTAPLAERLPHTCHRFDLEQGELRLPESAPDLIITLLRGGAREGNEGSRSVGLIAGGIPILLGGDAVAEGWSPGLRESLGRRPGGILLAPHHGSDGGRIGALLDALAPTEVWVSASSRPGIALELDRRGVPWKCTQDAGSLAWTPARARLARKSLP